MEVFLILIFVSAGKLAFSFPLASNQCVYDGKTYQVGESISDGNSLEEKTCFGIYCNDYGIIVEYYIRNCIQSTSTLPTTTRAMSTTDCGPDYKPMEGRSGDWCYGSYCEGGQIIYWDNFSCGTTAVKTTIPTTSSPTSQVT